MLCFGFRVTKELKISAYLLKQWNKNLSPLKSNTQKVHLRAISNLARSVETFMCDTGEWDFILSAVFYLCLLWGFSCLCAKDPRKSCITTSDSWEKDCEKEGWESLRHVHHRKQSQRGGAAEMENELSRGKKKHRHGKVWNQQENNEMGQCQLSHRMAQVGGDLKDHPVPTTCCGLVANQQVMLPRAPSTPTLNASRDGAQLRAHKLHRSPDGCLARHDFGFSLSWQAD